jgi:hypothetical protein
MNTIVYVCAWLELAIIILGVIGGPFLIDKPRGMYTSWSYIIGLVVTIPCFVLVGYVFGWW